MVLSCLRGVLMGLNVMNDVIFNGMTRGFMVSQIHMETDTSSWCYRATDAQLIEGYKEIFGLEDSPTECKVISDTACL
jgi:hypothetical protein